jgi:hypothetical protein
MVASEARMCVLVCATVGGLARMGPLGRRVLNFVTFEGIVVILMTCFLDQSFRVCGLC